jgi:hypothetical protein
MAPSPYPSALTTAVIREWVRTRVSTFDRPPPLGDTDRSRYVKLTTLEEAQGREMHKWIKQAGRVTGWK